MVTYDLREVRKWLVELSYGALNLHEDNTGLASAALELLPREEPPESEDVPVAG